MLARLSTLLPIVAIVCTGCGSKDAGSSSDIPTLIAAFKDESENGMVAARAMYKLVEIGKPAVPKLIEAVESSDVRVKLMALNTLGLIGPPASDAMPAVKAALGHPDTKVQSRAADALKKIESK